MSPAQHRIAATGHGQTAVIPCRSVAGFADKGVDLMATNAPALPNRRGRT